MVARAAVPLVSAALLGISPDAKLYDPDTVISPVILIPELVILTLSEPLALNIIVLSVPKLIVLSSSLPISNDEFFIDVIVVCVSVIAMSLAFAVIPSPPITFNTEFVVVKPEPANNPTKSLNDSFAAVPDDPPSKNNI